MLTDEEKEDYRDCTITNIRHGKGRHSKTVYAEVRDKDGRVMIAATLDYISKVLPSRLPIAPAK